LNDGAFVDIGGNIIFLGGSFAPVCFRRGDFADRLFFALPLQEALEACQTRISKMELQQQQQQVVQLEGLENATARTLLGKLINVLLALMAVLLVFVSTVANCVVPLMKTRSRSLSTLLLLLLLAFLWRNWDALSGFTHRALRPPG